MPDASEMLHFQYQKAVLHFKWFGSKSIVPYSYLYRLTKKKKVKK